MDYSISIILPNTLVYESAKSILTEHGWDYPIYRASQDRAVAIAKELIKKGTKVIISMGITYEYLKKELSVPLLSIPFSGIGALISIKKALEHSDKIVHVGTPQLYRYLQDGLDILNLSRNSIHFCELNLDKTVQEQTDEVLEQGYEVVIGGYDAVNQANLHNKTGIEINVDKTNIESTLFNARSVINQMFEREKNEQFEKAVFQSISEGLVVVDKKRQILKANYAAEEIIGSPLIGLKFEHALSSHNIVDFNSVNVNQLTPDSKYTPVFLNESSIVVDDDIRGHAISIKPLSEINEHMYMTRNELQLKGLYAEATFSSIVGTSRAMKEAKEQAAIYSQFDSPILISGETGTGKELFAQSIHNASRRKLNPWVSINCAALSENLIESELFGYEKGAFTGAKKEGKLGFFELADGGTIFLDEISELPISMQSKLLRVIQEGDVIRVGGEKVINVDVRITCSSNKNLLKLIEEKKFKEDLYYRLNVLEIEIPPLRERKEDISELANEFLKKFGNLHQKKGLKLLPSVVHKLKSLPLNGNVRELSNIIERMVILCPGTTIDDGLLTKVLNKKIYEPDDSLLKSDSANSSDVPSSDLQSAEKDFILQTLDKYNGNKTNTANALGISRATLWRKLRQYNMD